MKIIITGATGMVGEGVLLACLNHVTVSAILMVNRRPFNLQHAKLRELIVTDFNNLSAYTTELRNYDACFFCAGISSIGLNEEKYTQITFNTTINFAQTLYKLNPNMVFNYVSGSSTDSTESGKIMWARVKGKTENTLLKIGFKGVYNFRPGIMKPYPGQKNVKAILKPIIAIFGLLLPHKTLSLEEVAHAMINTELKGYSKSILEIKDIKILANN